MRFLVTAGPTREHIDTVRFISNASSGRMGYALASEAAWRGHEVVLISGPVELADPCGVEVVRVVSAKEMFDAAVERFAECHAAIMVAAVADFRPVARERTKLSKGEQSLVLTLEPTEDICGHLGHLKAHRVVVGFALEDHDHHAHAEAKLRRKGCDAIVLNRVETAGADWAEVEILRADTGWSAPLRGSKREIAAAVITLTETLVTGRV